MALHSFASARRWGGFAHAGRLPTLALAAVLILLVGIACARLLGGRCALPKP
jgi:hypothetical protein